MESIIKWISVSEDVPDLDEEVLVITEDNYVTVCIRSEVKEFKRGTDGYYFTGNFITEWGISENGGEYWHELDNVVLWAYLPESPL